MVRVMAKSTWATRIPAAIEKGEKKAASLEQLLLVLKDNNTDLHPGTAQQLIERVVTPGEVALAKALWDEWYSEHSAPGNRLIGEPPAALRAFVEKVEAL